MRFEPIFYDPVAMPANPTAVMAVVVNSKSETLRHDRYDCRRKPHSNKYRYRSKRAQQTSAFLNYMDNINAHRKATMLKRQDEFRENIPDIAAEIFRNSSNVLNETLGPNFYTPRRKND